MLARYGGEEFVVIMPETDIDGAMTAAEKIRQTIEKIEFLVKEETVRVTVSIGVSCIKDATSRQRIYLSGRIWLYTRQKRMVEIRLWHSKQMNLE